jgi:cytochrome c551/c552
MSNNISCSCFSRFVIAIFLSIFTLSSTNTHAADPNPDVAKGTQLFKDAGCTNCHDVHVKKVGPALKDVTKRWPSQTLLINFIRNSDKVKAQGDPYVTKLTADFGGMAMPNHEFLSEGDVKAILAYITDEGKKAGPDQGKKEEKVVVDGQPANDNSGFILTLILIVLVLVIIALSLVLIFIRKYLKDKESTLRDDERYLVNQKFEVGTFLRSKGFIGVVVFIFVCVGVRSCWMGMMSVGVEQNYEPKQPIPFSHKIHAGQYKINCNYCHTGVYKSKQANIPSINICMNCHSQIQEGAVYGKAAIGVLLEHNKKQQPIEWVRVHNLPDLAYFNHAQHVNAGGVECATCHGPIDSMDVVRQFSPLTMGWCINCHRKTDIKLKDNAYYQKFVNKHKSMTVENIGGLECSKCHY